MNMPGSIFVFIDLFSGAVVKRCSFGVVLMYFPGGLVAEVVGNGAVVFNFCEVNGDAGVVVSDDTTLHSAQRYFSAHMGNDADFNRGTG